MTLRDFSSGNWIGLAAMTAAALLLGVLLGKMRGQQQYRPSPSREPAPEIAAATSTNKSDGPTLTRKDGLKLLEEELTRSLKQFAPLSSPQSSIEARAQPPPMRQATSSKRKKDGDDPKRDLIFMTPEDLAKAPTLEEAFGLPEFDEQGREKPRQSAMERYFSRLDEKSAAKSSGTRRSDPFASASESEKSRNDSRDDSSLPDSLKNSEQALRKALASNGGLDSLFRTGPGSRSGDTASDLFGFGQQKASAADPKNNWVEQYRQMLQVPFGTGGSDSQLAGRPGSPATPESFAPTPVRREADPLPLGTLKPFSTDSSFGDPSQRVLNQWDPYYRPPTQEYKRVAPPKPTFEAPRRKF
jgi:hypothetical protein